MTKMLTDHHWQQTAAELAACEKVEAAWVFGSAGDGLVRPGGDIDVGVLWQERPSLDDLIHLRMALQQTLDYDDIDLVTLNDASTILRFEAVSGRSLFYRDAGRRAVFVSLTAREYEDEMVMVQRVWRDYWTDA